MYIFIQACVSLRSPGSIIRTLLVCKNENETTEVRKTQLTRNKHLWRNKKKLQHTVEYNITEKNFFFRRKIITSAKDNHWIGLKIHQE